MDDGLELPTWDLVGLLISSFLLGDVFQNSFLLFEQCHGVHKLPGGSFNWMELSCRWWFSALHKFLPYNDPSTVPEGWEVLIVLQ